MIELFVLTCMLPGDPDVPDIVPHDTTYCSDETLLTLKECERRADVLAAQGGIKWRVVAVCTPWAKES